MNPDFIYVHSPNHSRAGEVVKREIDTDAQGYPVSDDYVLFASGTPEHICEVARTFQGPTYQSAESKWLRDCARSVLEYYGANDQAGGR